MLQLERLTRSRNLWGLSVEEAALSIKRIVDANMGNEIYKEINLKGYDPREFMLIAVVGRSGVHCAGYLDFIEVSKTLVCPSSVSVMDIVMIYEATNIVKLSGEQFLSC